MYLRVMRLKYDQVGGRAGRREFWLFMLVHVVLLAIARVLDFVIPLTQAEWYESGPIYPIYWVIALVPVLAVVSRRLHDTGRSGWYQALMAAWLPTVVFGRVAIDFLRDGADSGTVALAMIALFFFGAALVGTLMLLIFAVLPGDPDENKYGLPAESPDRLAVYWLAIATRYAKFRGRAGRKEFWLFVLVGLTVPLIAHELDQWLFPGSFDGGISPILMITLLANVVPALALFSRRLHDVGLPAWLLLFLITPIGLIGIITVAFLPSQEGENKHGEPAIAPE